MVISQELRDQIAKTNEKYPEQRGGLLPALHLVQKEFGEISEGAAKELAEIFGIYPAEVLEVVSFYNMFLSHKGGKHHAYVCTNLPCSLKGSRVLLKKLEAYFGIHAGETTKDGKLTLGHEECLGACAYAPMMRVDETYHEDLDFEKAKQILESLE